MWSSSSSSSSSSRSPPPLLPRALLHMKKCLTRVATPRRRTRLVGGTRTRKRRPAEAERTPTRSPTLRSEGSEARTTITSWARPCSGRRSERDDRRRTTADRQIVKVFNVRGCDGSVQVPKPSAILFRRTSTIALHKAVTPSPRDHHAQPSAAILERQMHLAGLLRGEGGDAVGCALSTTTAGASQGGKRIAIQGDVVILIFGRNRHRGQGGADDECHRLERRQEPLSE